MSQLMRQLPLLQEVLSKYGELNAAGPILQFPSVSVGFDWYKTRVQNTNTK